MCYTGRCPYEHSGGEAAGESKLRDDEPVPDDAECVLMDKWIDEWERNHPISMLCRRMKQDVMLLSLRLRGQNEIPF